MYLGTSHISKKLNFKYVYLTVQNMIGRNFDLLPQIFAAIPGLDVAKVIQGQNSGIDHA